jgi:aryl-alcohol dehydrogenase-like predicted oxidoreductase
MKLPGYATPSGTEWYRKRFAKSVAPEHFRQSQNLWLSSIGLGTYLGNYDAETDQLYHRAVVRAVESGCNVIDSAINYRLQRSERPSALRSKSLRRRALTRRDRGATKGGFIPYDGAPPADPRRYLDDTFSSPAPPAPRHRQRLPLHDAKYLAPA